MKSLYNSHGEPIALWDDDDLFTLSGEFVGCYECSTEIFITCDGGYLGEVIEGDYLVAHRRSPHRETSFAVPAPAHRISHDGRVSPAKEIRLPSGYEDVDRVHLPEFDGEGALALRQREVEVPVLLMTSDPPIS